jgi:hypothetical protein
MLYISLILIAAGIFFIIYTLLLKTKKHAELSGSKIISRPASHGEQLEKINEKSSAKLDNKVSITGQENINSVSFESQNTGTDITAEKEIVQDIHQDFQEKERAGTEPFNGKSAEVAVSPESADAERKVPVVFSAALYEDLSEIIDYDNNDSAIDLSFNEYKKIRRICAGNIEIVKDGINFRSGKKLFRFDFQQVANIKTGSNYFALFIKKSKSSRLFLYNQDLNFSASVLQAYNSYSKNVFHI